MTGSLDDFDGPQHEIDTLEEGQPRNAKRNLASAWKNSPIFKLLVIVIAGGALATTAIGMFSSKEEPKPVSMVSHGSAISAAPGGAASPAFQQAVADASHKRAEFAAGQGGSALPTPIGGNMIGDDNGANKQNDPLAEFRRELDHVQEQQKQRESQLRHDFVQQQDVVQKQDDNLAQLIRTQMNQLVSAWTPKNISMIKITPVSWNVPGSNAAHGGNGEGLSKPSNADLASQALANLKIIVNAGTVSYGQLLIEANSDVPGPVMAQILSGPLSGGRAIGSFQTEDDYLVVRFHNVNFKNKDYPVDILVLDPDTTLGGMATEVDHRYVERLVLPAAAGFLSGFSQAFAQEDTSTSVTGDVVVQQASQNGLRQGLAQGGQQAAQSAQQFLQNQANSIRPLVRIAAGTAVGLFFVESVAQDPDELRRIEALQGGTNNNPLANSGIAGLSNTYATTTPVTTVPTQLPYPAATNAYPQTAYPGYSSSPYGTTTGYGTTSPYSSGVTSVPNNNVVYVGAH